MRDVVVAVVGASAAIAGFVLVFLGVLAAAYQSIIGTVSEKSKARFKVSGIVSLAVFGLALTSLALGVSWLIADGGRCFYVVVLVAFFASLAALALDAAYVTIYVLLRG